jgi:hypothetical protein
MLTPALSCLHCPGDRCLLSGELERCTDLQVVPSALEIACHLLAAAAAAAAPSRFHTMNPDNKMWWFAAFVHFCRETKPGMPGLTKDCVMRLRWRDWYFARLLLVQEPAWCSHLLVVGRWLELRLIVGSHTVAEAAREA